jgi:hypothetical protein
VSEESGQSLIYRVKNKALAWNQLGALYGYCPRCGAPGEMREAIDGSGRDRCQNKHSYKSIEAVSKDSIAQSKRGNDGPASSKAVVGKTNPVPHRRKQRKRG